MKDEKIKSVFLAAGSVFLVVFCLSPFAFMVLVSLNHDPDFLAGKTFRMSLEHYAAVLSNPSVHFMDLLKNSFTISFMSAFLCVWIAAFSAYAVTRLRFPGKSALLLAILAISMFPQVSLLDYLFGLMSDLGLINILPALLGPYIAWILPLCLWILTGYFTQIPRELDEAGRIDGCSRAQCLYKIILPVALPGIFSAGLLSFIFAFNEFLFALMLTTDYHARTIPVGIAFFEGTHGQIPWGEIMAASSLTVLPLLGLALLFQRKIVHGLTRGAVKE